MPLHSTRRLAGGSKQHSAATSWQDCCPTPTKSVLLFQKHTCCPLRLGGLVLQWQHRKLHYEASGCSVSASLQAEESGLGRREVISTSARCMRGVQGVAEQREADRLTNQGCAAAPRGYQAAVRGGHRACARDEQELGASAAAAPRRASRSRAPPFCALCSRLAGPPRAPSLAAAACLEQGRGAHAPRLLGCPLRSRAP